MSTNYILNTKDNINFNSSNITLYGKLNFNDTTNTTLYDISQITKTNNGTALVYDGANFNVIDVFNTGPTGPQGSSNNGDGQFGPTGPQGPMGATGPDGQTGNTGIEGPKGPPGDQGSPGEDGPPGENGDKGPSGPIGPDGEYETTDTTETSIFWSPTENVIENDLGHVINSQVKYYSYNIYDSNIHDTELLFHTSPGNTYNFCIGIIEDKTHLLNSTGLTGISGSFASTDVVRGNSHNFCLELDDTPKYYKRFNDDFSGGETTLPSIALNISVYVKNKSLYLKYNVIDGLKEDETEALIWENITYSYYRFYIYNFGNYAVLNKLRLNNNKKNTIYDILGPTGMTGGCSNLIINNLFKLDSDDGVYNIEQLFSDTLIDSTTFNIYNTITLEDNVYYYIEVKSLIEGVNKKGYIIESGLYRYFSTNTPSEIICIVNTHSKSIVGDLTGDETGIINSDPTGLIEFVNFYVYETGNMTVSSKVSIIKSNQF